MLPYAEWAWFPRSISLNAYNVSAVFNVVDKECLDSDDAFDVKNELFSNNTDNFKIVVDTGEKENTFGLEFTSIYDDDYMKQCK
jgi:hypothetical protein